MNKVIAVFAALLLLAVSGTSGASIIDIQFTGLDITYDGSTITADGLGGVDDLSTLVVEAAGIEVATYSSSDSIDVSMSIDVAFIPVAGGPGTFSGPGSFSLGINGGGLDLTITDATVIYEEITAGTLDFKFIFTGASAAIDSQSLPGGLIMGEPVTVSFSTQIVTESIDGDYFDAFTSSGTGEVQGTLVPVPAAVWLFGSGLIGLAGIARRDKSV
jgi:hypothetical protein